MKVFLIICAVIALIDVVVVGAIMKNSSRASRIEEAELERIRVKERGNGG